jgi:hypothetical protein
MSVETTEQLRVEDALWHTARGIRPEMAATEILLHIPALCSPRAPWIRHSDDHARYWIDADVLARSASEGWMSGQERKIAKLVASLMSDDHMVNLRDVLSGLDDETAVLVVQCLAFATGSASALSRT